jgi:hypothetical protein
MTTMRKWRIYDAGPELGDRFTLVYRGSLPWRCKVDRYMLGLNSNPFHPSHGYCQHVEGQDSPHLGKRIGLEDLPDDCLLVLFREAMSFIRSKKRLAALQEVASKALSEYTETIPGFKTFFAQYVETALWSSNDRSDDQGGEPLDSNYSIRDIHPDTLHAMRMDCLKFWQETSETLIGTRFEDAGHDFWLTRNGHGAGFWDGDWNEAYGDGSTLGEALTKISKKFGEMDLYVENNRVIHS